MQVASDAPKRPAARYYGGKFKLAKWVIEHFPPHLNYIEPCCGMASILLQKPRSPLETINDIDGNVVNFFRVLRDSRDELLQKISLTPWAREEYEYCLQAADEPVERARRFFAVSCMSFNGATRDDKSTYGWRNSTDHRLRSTPALDMYNNDLGTVAERLIGVQIEHRPWLEVVERLDNDEALIYLDPPYVQDERTKGFRYLHEWDTKAHRTAAAALNKCVGYVIVSGYACPLYTELYEAHGWHRVDKEAQTNSGGKRVESLWLSPRTWASLSDDYSSMPLFGGL